MSLLTIASDGETGTAKLVVENFVSKTTYSQILAISNKGNGFCFGVIPKSSIPGFTNVIFIYMSFSANIVSNYKVSILNANNEKLFTRGIIRQILIYRN